MVKPSASIEEFSFYLEILKKVYVYVFIAQLAGAVEYTGCTSAEG